MDIIYKKISELIPYEKNAKKHDKQQIDRIALSLDRYGWKQPVVIDKDNVIIVGHGRVEGAKKSQKWKNKPVPCVVADDLTEEEIREYRLADNKLNESEWDIELLDVELQDIEFDMSEFGFGFHDEEEFDEDDLDDDCVKDDVIISVNCKTARNYEQIKDRIAELAEEIGGTVSVKMG